MEKAELLDWLREEYRHWQAFINQIDPALMDLPGVNGQWSLKDMIAHLTAWEPRLIAYILAAQHGEADPPSPWPEHLRADDEINAWIYETYCGRTVNEVLDEMERVFQQLLAVIEGLPDEVVIEPERHLVLLGGRRFPAGEFFDHFHNEHEADVRAWLARMKQ